MTRQTAGELLQELAQAQDLTACIQQNESQFCRDTVPSFLAALYRKRTISKAELARRSGVSQVYLHQVFAGRRTPSRDRLLCLCFGLSLSLDETQRLLRLAVCAPLWPLNRRDAIVLYSISHGLTLPQAEQALQSLGERPLH